MKINKTRGFTLVELLVVISIIALLSSVVLASTVTIRARSRDSAIISEVQQLRNLMHLEYSDAGSYSGLQGSPSGWVVADSGICPAGAFSSPTRAAKALEICNKIAPLISGTGNRLYVGTVNTGVVPAVNAGQSFTIMATLSSSARIFCVGHNGKTSNAFQLTSTQDPTFNTPPTPTFGYTNDGCWADPTNK